MISLAHRVSPALLIIVLQISASIAGPVIRQPQPCECEEVTEVVETERFAPRIQNPQEEPDIIHSVWQIPDGQVQAPYLPPIARATTSAVLTSSALPPQNVPGAPPPQDVPGVPDQAPNSTPDNSYPQLPNPADVPTLLSPTPVSPVTFSSAAVVPVETTPVSTIAETTIPDTSLPSLTTSAVITPTEAPPTNTVGSVQTSLETSGQPTTLPFPTAVNTSTSSLSLIDTSTVSVTPTAPLSKSTINVEDIFQTIAVDPLPSQISQRSDHPVPRTGIQPQIRKLETNKFYANMFLGDQTAPIFTFPYSLVWLKGGGKVTSWGIGISHTERSQLAYGSTEPVTGAWSFYANPIGLHSIILSAGQLGEGTTLTMDQLEGMSARILLTPLGQTKEVISFPLVQGMGYITASYTSATPIISSSIGISNVTYSGSVVDSSYHKYRFSLTDGTTWLVYVLPLDQTYEVNRFGIVPGTGFVQGPSGFTGYIQVAKIPLGDSNAETIYDQQAGTWPSYARVSGTVAGTTGSYTISYTKNGDTSRRLLMFALPHHISSFSAITAQAVSSTQLMTTTKGLGTAVIADSWTLTETDLPISMDFAPWSSGKGSVTDVSSAAQALINEAATAELAQNMHSQTDLNSMYYSGKALAKFAAVVYTAHDIAKNASLALTGLQKLEDVFEQFINNTQIFPLVYDSAWGGVVSSASYVTGDAGADFGNTYYNDHHFHYGYFVYAAAVIGYLDPVWLTTGTNKAWIDMLVRDYANSIPDDPYFPFSRSFDWYHGHSWAKGLFASADGKDQESSSEDTMASYGIKMWGRITGDLAMEARGNLMLAIQARTLADYYLFTSDNTIQPPQFIGNKAGGILFENKIDHTTYFGGNTEYIEGIHMIPIMPFSTLTRRQQFVVEEWNTYFLTYVNQVQSAWRGILMANLAIIDPVTSFTFFANYSGAFTLDYLDGGASQTWYLAYAAALGGSPATTKRDDVEEKVSIWSRSADGGVFTRLWKSLWSM